MSVNSMNSQAIHLLLLCGPHLERLSECDDSISYESGTCYYDNYFCFQGHQDNLPLEEEDWEIYDELRTES